MALINAAAVVAAVALLPSAAATTANPKSILVDFNTVVGNLSTFIHGFDNGPLCSTGANYSLQMQAVGGTHIRNHDMGVLDWNTIFPNPDADETDPANYNFVPGDVAFANMLNAGFTPYFRVGNSWTNPIWSARPANLTKFATITVNTLRHYNEAAFAGGFTGHAIRRVEIWNEPDEGRFWNSTPSYFYSLFDTTARAIRAYDPAILVGGPAVALLSDTPYSSDFLQHVAAAGTPFDFFSWHHYGWPWAANASQYAAQAAQARAMITAAGLTPSTGSYLTEWNIGVLTDRPDSAAAASFVASTLIYLTTPGQPGVDLSIFYPGCNSENPSPPTNVTDGWGMWGDSAADPPSAPSWRPMSHAYLTVGSTMRDTPLQLPVSYGSAGQQEANYVVLAGKAQGVGTGHSGSRQRRVRPQGTPAGVAPGAPDLSVVVSAESSPAGYDSFSLTLTGVPTGRNWGGTVSMIDGNRSLVPVWTGILTPGADGSMVVPTVGMAYPAVAWVELTLQ